MRRIALALLVCVTLAACVHDSGGLMSAEAVAVQVPSQAPVLGQSSAPVTLVEIGSFGCAVCDEFRETVLPQIEARFVRSGRLKVQYLELGDGGPSDSLALALECLPDSLDPFTAIARVKKVMFGRQDGETRASTDLLAKLLGVSSVDLRQCLERPSTRELRKAQVASFQRAHVRATPTFVVGFSDGRRTVVGIPIVGLANPDSLLRLIEAVTLHATGGKPSQ